MAPRRKCALQFQQKQNEQTSEQRNEQMILYDKKLPIGALHVLYRIVTVPFPKRNNGTVSVTLFRSS